MVEGEEVEIKGEGEDTGLLEIEQKPVFLKQNPYLEVKISQLGEINVKRVSLLGTVVMVDANNYLFGLDDGSGTITCIVNDSKDFERVVPKKVLRVFGRPLTMGEEIELQVEIVSDYSGIDNFLYERVFELVRGGSYEK